MEKFTEFKRDIFILYSVQMPGICLERHKLSNEISGFVRVLRSLKKFDVKKLKLGVGEGV